ncbi:hypothetical protein VITU102760_12300 [Vibrio tubiashii]|uniref:Uncharacterized protein n=1 Tax=Vibrio tubiashii ATCC 19109 TaxID=1051646 RepID=F9T003_9VIBR|nr:hypothetical protein [Vibrio tubiashii]AIW16272.1 hypothetical protein IX91_19435 [Vibrio tubiashii ATCC 19109]EGU59081.1 hypothetical protein VITU9109_19045 [Vibrio tubiashii ATCC 19109]EIF04759.1 hypothetical protein VT1337_06496 [Vibrio tubiashii NCIMB 1337 = ATCC 19106]
MELKVVKTLARQSKLTPESIKLIYRKRAGEEVLVRSRGLGNCSGFEVQIGNQTIYLTDRPISYYTSHYHLVTKMQQRILSVAVPIPLYIGQGDMDLQLHRVLNSSIPETAANKWLLDVFSIDVAMAYFNKYFLASNYFSDYKTIIFEAIEAFYLGMDHIAIISLMPVFEAGLRNAQEQILCVDKGNVSAKAFEQGLKDLILVWGRNQVSAYDWYPGKDHNPEVEIEFFTQINPQCDVINAFRLYFAEVLYKTSNGGSGGFNRHLIVHLLKNDFNEPSNFIRIFLALTHILFIESLYNDKVPFFWQGIDEKDVDLGNYIRNTSRSFGDYRCKFLNRMGISNYDLSV